MFHLIVIKVKTREVDERALCSSMENLNHLCHLSVMASSEEEVLHMKALSSPPPRLKRLNLIRKLDKFPHWFQSRYQLKALYLSWSRLPEDPLTYIQSLPNLQRLTLVNGYIGRCLHFPQGFLTLKSLILHNFPGLNEIVMENGVVQGFQNLWLFRCMVLETLSQGIEHLTNLQQINLKNVSQVLIKVYVEKRARIVLGTLLCLFQAISSHFIHLHLEWMKMK